MRLGRCHRRTTWPTTTTSGGIRSAATTALFEKLRLEAFQSGLSWLTILRKREAFRAAFAGFDVGAVAAFGPADVERLLADAGIVRNRAKVEATIANARAALELPDGLAGLLWSFAPPPGDRPRPASFADVAGEHPESTAMAKDLNRRGFRFVGPTTAYALMQASGHGRRPPGRVPRHRPVMGWQHGALGGGDLPDERHEAERLFHHDTLELTGLEGRSAAPGDEVLVVAGREHPAVVALGRVRPGGAEHDPDDPQSTTTRRSS